MLRANEVLCDLTNIGPTIAAKLAAVGIETVGDLRRISPAGAFKLVKANNPGMTLPVCYYLYSLQGALDGIHWNVLPEKKKRVLLRDAESA